MAEVEKWQRQSMKKGAGSSAPFEHNSKVHPSGVVSNLHSKIAMPTHGLGGLVLSPAKGFADGGEVDKQAGLESSKGENVGFLERLRMGNIDDSSSEAYRRFGAGRAQEDRAEAARETARFASRAATNAVERAAAKAVLEAPPAASESASADAAGDIQPSVPDWKDPSTPAVPMAAARRARRVTASATPPKPAPRVVDNTSELTQGRDAYTRLPEEPIAARQAAPSPSQPVLSSAQQRLNATFQAPENYASMSPAERSQDRGRRFRDYLKGQFNMADGGPVKGKKNC